MQPDPWKNLPETRPPSLIMSGDTDHLLLSRSLSFISTDDLGVCFCSRPYHNWSTAGFVRRASFQKAWTVQRKWVRRSGKVRR